MKKKILHIRKFQDITYFLRRTFRTRTPNFETHPHRLRLRTTTFKINPYRLRLRTTIFKINPYRLRLRTTILKINQYRLRLRTTVFKINPYRLRLPPRIGYGKVTGTESVCAHRGMVATQFTRSQFLVAQISMVTQFT